MLIFTGPVLILLSQPPFYESLIKILPVDTVFGAALLTEKSRGSHTLAHQNKLGSPSLSPNPWHPNWGLGIFSCHHCSGHCEAHHSLRPNELDQPKGQILPLPIFVNNTLLVSATPIIFVLSVAALMLQWHNWAVVTNPIWPTDLKIFTIWLSRKSFLTP